MTEHITAFSGSLSLRSLERGLVEALQPGPLSGSLVFDLSDVTFLDLHSLMTLSAILSRHSKKKRKVRIELPVRDLVCEFIAAWDFPAAIEEVVSATRGEIFGRPGDERLLRLSDPTKNRYMQARPDPLGVIERLYSARFFSIQTFSRQLRLFGPTLAVELTRHWRTAMVERVLENMIAGGSDLVRTRIVYEAVMNAVRHPNARLIQTACQVRRVANATRLTVIFWDDGKWIHQTLRSALRGGRPITGEAFGTIGCQYKTWVGTKGRDQGRLQADIYPTASWGDAELLLASTFPGVTSDYLGLSQPSGTKTKPGMGLYYLVNAAVTVLGGRVTLQAGRAHVQLTRPSRSADQSFECFNARLRSTSSPLGIDGNLVRIDLPLAPSTQGKRK